MLLLSFGKISKVHGKTGELKIVPFSKRSDNLLKLERLFIKKHLYEEPTEYKISKVRNQNNTSIIKLEDIGSIEAAEQLKGSIVMVDKTDLPELNDDEYYALQLIGLRVITNEGLYIGKITNVIDRAPQDILIVQNGGHEYLIPMIDTIISEINLEDSKVIICPLVGLID